MSEEASVKVCVGNYGAYGAGYLIDEWFELPMAPQELKQRLGSMQREAERLTHSPCEEFYISDYDDCPLPVGSTTYKSLFSMHTLIEDLNLMAAQLATMDEREIEVAGLYLDEIYPVTMARAMNALLQVDEIPYYAYDYQSELLSPELLSPEFKFGCTCIEENPDLKALLGSDSTIDSAFDYESYGRLSAEVSNVSLHDNGYLAFDARSVDLDYFNQEEIFEEVVNRVVASDIDQALSDAFQAWYEEEIASKTQAPDTVSPETHKVEVLSVDMLPEELRQDNPENAQKSVLSAKNKQRPSAPGSQVAEKPSAAQDRRAMGEASRAQSQSILRQPQAPKR